MKLLAILPCLSLAACSTEPQDDARDPRALKTIRTKAHLAAQGGGTTEPPTAEATADIVADTNRDGRVDSADEAGEDDWSTAHGAVMVANLDDDDGDGKRDASDDVLSGTTDLADLAPVILRRYRGLARDASVSLSVEAPAQSEVRIFADREGDIVELYAPGSARVSIPAEWLSADDVRLFVEAIEGRHTGWDGLARITLTVAGSDGTTEQDSVMLRSAPVIFQDNTLDAKVLYVMKIDDPQLDTNEPFFRALDTLRPRGVALYPVDQYRYQADRWLQDNMEFGYQVLPSETGPHLVSTILETKRPTGRSGLEPFATGELLGRDTGYVFPGGRATSHNYGGNIEVSPPVTLPGSAFPWGRLVIGGGSLGQLDGTAREEHMTPRQRSFLDAQVQGPAVEVSTEWLAVGHIDEIMQMVPDLSGASPRGFKVVIASPAQARRALERLRAEGDGRAVVFRGRSSQTTVREILDDETRMTFNAQAQARIDTVRSAMARGLGLTNADFVEVPVLYEPLNFDGEILGAAYNPGIQNLVTLNDTLFVPDPEGPKVDGVDVFQALTREALEPLGLTVHFVDVFESYHEKMGEAHCGTGVLRAPHATAWWTVE